MLRKFPKTLKHVYGWGLLLGMGTASLAAETPVILTDAVTVSADIEVDDLPEQAANAEVEIIRERYANSAIKVERHVTQDAQGNYFNHGPWTYWDEQGQLIGGGEYALGQRHGQWVRYYDGSEPVVAQRVAKQFKAPFRAEATFVQGQLHGQWTIIDSLDRPVLSWSYEHGLRHGKSISFHATGEKWQEADYVRGEIQGTVLEHGPDGKVISREEYLDGRKLTQQVDLYPTNSKKLEGPLLAAKDQVELTEDFWAGKVEQRLIGKGGDDLKHGTWIGYHPNGQKAMEGKYQNGMPEGTFTWWHDNGQKALEGQYVDGAQDGRWIWWHPNGMKHIDGHYVADNLNGSWTWWNTEGRVSETAVYSEADVTSRVALQPTLEPNIESPNGRAFERALERTAEQRPARAVVEQRPMPRTAGVPTLAPKRY